MAVKIKLTRFGKIRNPQYRISVADARNRRDGRVHRGHRPVPPEGRAEPHRDRFGARQYWLGVGASPPSPCWPC